MRKAITGLITVALVALLSAVVYAAVAPSDGSRSAGTTTGDETTTTEDRTTTTDKGQDVSGPCDEAEHANDPRCAGAQGQRREDRRQDRREAGEDISGPCDEAEHANDPRCTGAGQAPVRQRHDNSGPGSSNSGPGSHHGDDRVEQRAGGDDHGGRGREDDNDRGGDDRGGDDRGGDDRGGDDDHSGSGRGGDDDRGGDDHGGGGHGGSGRG